MDYSQTYSKQNIQKAIQRFNQLKAQYGQNAPTNPEFLNVTRFLRASSQYQQMEMAKRQQNNASTPGTPTLDSFGNGNSNAQYMPNNQMSMNNSQGTPNTPAFHPQLQRTPVGQPQTSQTTGQPQTGQSQPVGQSSDAFAKQNQNQNQLLSVEDTQLSRVQISAFKFLFKNQPLPAELYTGLMNHYNTVRATQPEKVVKPQSQVMPQVMPQAMPAVKTQVVSSDNKVGSRPLVLMEPEPPIIDTKISQRFPDSRVYKVKDPNVLVDAFSVPIANEKVAYSVLTSPKTRIITPGVFPQGIDVEGAHQIRESTVALRIDAAAAYLEEYLKGELDEADAIAAENELNALRLLSVQKTLRGKYLLFTWFQNTLLANTHPNFLAKIRKVDLQDALVTSSVYNQQQMALRLLKKKQKINKISNKLARAQQLAGQRAAVFDSYRKLSKHVASYHANVEKEEQKRVERNAKQRLQALKANDEEAYIKLLDQTKDTRITHLLRQTNAFLLSLTDSVKAQQQETRELSLHAGHAIESEEEFKKQYGDDADTTDLDYYNVAHRYKEVVTKQPSILVGGTLKEYQLKGLQWMVSLFNNHLNGILADEMGLGKTIQTISLITYLVEVKKVPGPFLVIVPLSTLTNWNLEFDKWAPSVKKITFKGSPTQRRAMHHDIRTGNFQILLTTFDYILKDRPLLAKVKWVHMIIDEGHRMKNTKSKLSYTLTTYYHTDYRLILTGTPLQNNLPELWALLNFVLPRIFNSVKSFDEWFNTPFASTGSQDRMDLSEEETLLVIRRLHKVLRPFLLRRLKKDVEKDLPNKIERVIKCKMSALQQRLYRHMLDHRTLFAFDASHRRLYPIKGNNNPIMQLKKIVNHPFVYDEIEDTINPSHETDDLIWRVSGKFEILDRVLPKLKASGHRVLLFFQMTSIMTIMEDFLNLRGLKYLRLDGATKSDDRTRLLKVFNAPDSDYFAFLLSTRAGGLGLNLQTADTVIIFDTDWNPHQDLQAQDRAHRIGQKNEVRILRLITQDSVEEMVLERAHEKLDIDGKVIQAGKFDNKSTAEEQEALLRQLMEADEMKKGNNDDDDEELTADELNEILARTEDEKKLFKQIDDQMDTDWKNRNLKKGVNVSRLYDLSELPEYYKKEPELKKSSVVEGARAKKKISYVDESLSEFEWSKANGLVEDDMFMEDEDGRKRRGRKRIKYDDLSLDEEPNEELRGSHDLNEESRSPNDLNEEPRKRRIDDVQDTFKTKRGKGKPRGRGRRGRLSRKTEDQQPQQQQHVELNPDQRGRLQATLKTIYTTVLEYKEVMTEYEDHPVRYLSELFKEKPSRKLYPDYYAIIKKPISLKEIKKKISGFNYYTLEEFMADLHLMFSNAKLYNQEGSIVYNDAIKLESIANEQAQKLQAEQPESTLDDKLALSMANGQSNTTSTSFTNTEDESNLAFSLDNVDSIGLGDTPF